MNKEIKKRKNKRTKEQSFYFLFLKFFGSFVIRNQFGQGLLETVISLGIITSGLIGMLSLTVSNQTAGGEASDRLVATYLAREGVEAARQMRDSNWLNRLPWDQGLESGVDYTAALLWDSATNARTLDFTPADLTHAYTRLWRAGGLYFQSTQATPPGAALTSYRRLLRLDEICRDKTVATGGSACSAGLNPKIGIRAQSTVEWDAKGNTHQLVMEERLFNWR